jgi:hypothetical protein
MDKRHNKPTKREIIYTILRYIKENIWKEIFSPNIIYIYIFNCFNKIDKFVDIDFIKDLIDLIVACIIANVEKYTSIKETLFLGNEPPLRLKKLIKLYLFMQSIILNNYKDKYEIQVGNYDPTIYEIVFEFIINHHVEYITELEQDYKNIVNLIKQLSYTYKPKVVKFKMNLNNRPLSNSRHYTISNTSNAALKQTSLNQNRIQSPPTRSVSRSPAQQSSSRQTQNNTPRSNSRNTPKITLRKKNPPPRSVSRSPAQQSFSRKLIFSNNQLTQEIIDGLIKLREFPDDIRYKNIISQEIIAKDKDRLREIDSLIIELHKLQKILDRVVDETIIPDKSVITKRLKILFNLYQTNKNFWNERKEQYDKIRRELKWLHNKNSLTQYDLKPFPDYPYSLINSTQRIFIEVQKRKKAHEDETAEIKNAKKRSSAKSKLITTLIELTERLNKINKKMNNIDNYIHYKSIWDSFKFKYDNVLKEIKWLNEDANPNTSL